ncbi:MAG: prepilin peptidase [Gemmatimonadetes bacterium]|nr:prepilin peptidase [Gemmatimonadota bacterium]
MSNELVWIAATGLGLIVGSFLNVCIMRWPAEESVIRPRSRCPGCSAPIAAYDNIPVLSWLVLRGACRQCRAPISVQYPIIELATGLIWLGAAIRFGASVQALHSAAFLTILLGIAMTDALEMVIPDQFSLGGTALGLALAALPGDPAIVGAVVGAVVSYVLLWAIKVVAERMFRKPALGVGDIHMMAMVGAYLGTGGALLTILLGALLGLLIGVPLMWRRDRLKPMNTYLPLGTFLALGAAVAHAWGDRLIAWYLSVFLGTNGGGI